MARRATAAAAALPDPIMSTSERALYMVAGLGLAAAALKPRPNPLLNVLALLGGSYLAWRGTVGTDPVRQSLMAKIEDAKRLTQG